MRFRHHQAQAQASTTRLLLLFAAVVLGLVLAVNLALALVLLGLGKLTPFALGLPPYFFVTNTVLVLMYVLGGWWIESSRLHHDGQGAQRIAQMLGAREAQPSGNDETARRERRLLNVIHEMALAARMDPPTAWVLPRDDAINALAAGWGDDAAHRDTAVIVTRGALERLSRAELQGVLAHELSHIQHGDTRLNMQLVGMVWGLQLIWSLGRELSAPVQGRLPALAPMGWALQAVGWLGWLAGRILQAAVSRQREYLADATAVKSTRQVDGLGGALRKIADQAMRHRTALVADSSGIVAHLLLASPFDEARHASLRRWLATHPSLPDRLERLYGYSVMPLDDRVVPITDDEPLSSTLSAMAIAPRGAAPSADAGSTIPVERVAAAPTLPHAYRPAGTPVEGTEAERHDAYQIPAHSNQSAQQRDATERIRLWGGPGEWQAAMLALAQPGWDDARWQAMTADLRVAAAVRHDIALLGPAAKRWAIEHLVQRAQQNPVATRLALWRQWAARLRSQAHGPGPVLQLLVTRHRLAPPWRIPQGSGAAWIAPSVHAATRAMALALPLTDNQRRRWWQAATQALSAYGFDTSEAIRQRGLAPTVHANELFCALRVRRLSAMQKPLLIKAWLQASDDADLPLTADEALADGLHWACLGLGLPTPAQIVVAA
jgi:Zn-dependent protease with chaperone function